MRPVMWLDENVFINAQNPLIYIPRHSAQNLQREIEDEY